MRPQAKVVAALPGLKAETTTPVAPELPELPPMASIPVEAKPTQAPKPDPAKAYATQAFYTPPTQRPRDKNRGAQPKLEAVTVISDVVSLPSRGSVGSRGAEVDQLPQKGETNPAPPYPPEALAAGLEGRVVLRVKIDAAGKVTNIRIHKSSKVEALDQSALDTVRRWVFNPARRKGVAVAYEVDVPIEFSINQGR